MYIVVHCSKYFEMTYASHINCIDSKKNTEKFPAEFFNTLKTVVKLWLCSCQRHLISRSQTKLRLSVMTDELTSTTQEMRDLYRFLCEKKTSPRFIWNPPIFFIPSIFFLHRRIFFYSKKKRIVSSFKSQTCFIITTISYDATLGFLAQRCVTFDRLSHKNQCSQFVYLFKTNFHMASSQFQY